MIKNLKEKPVGKGVAVIINIDTDKKLQGVEFNKILTHMKNNNISIEYNANKSTYLTIEDFRYPVHFKEWDNVLIINLVSNKLLEVDDNGWVMKYIANRVKDAIVNYKIQ